MRNLEIDPIAQNKHRNAIEDQLQKVEAARQRVEGGPMLGDDDENAQYMEELLEDLMENQEHLNQEQLLLGLPEVETSAAMAEAHSAILSKSPGTLLDQYKNKLAMVEQGAMEMRDNLNTCLEDSLGSKGSESSPRTHEHTHTSDDTHSVGSSSDEEEGEPMSPRGVYVQRCQVMSHEELEVERDTWAPFIRGVRTDPLGLFLFILYLFAAMFYVYTRIFHSLSDLGGLLWYGAIMFAVELLSIISLVFYGVWLISVTRNDEGVMDKAAGLRRQYNIRVMIPCKDESLSVVRRTISAIRRAVVPEGCHLIVYLCDEARDTAKRNYVNSLKSSDIDVIYITGRPREERTRNYRAEMLNYTMSLIYPFDTLERDGHTIPLTELMCLMDADQTCSSSFFVNLMRYMDSGDDVAAALSPKIMFNVEPDCDIFNHQNVHFWEKMQPGMDAFGFISLSSTNMILRVRALQECGWFPAQTVTEDWELGMHMKAGKWKSRYVQEYCAIGEAPSEVSQAYKQHYRHARGHFQTFWSENCPLGQRRLGILYRFFYSSKCLALTAAGLGVPFFTAFPIIFLIFGAFPLSLNFWTVMGVTVYYIVQTLLFFYCSSMRQFTALWLSNVATTLMWWPSLKSAVLTPLKYVIGSDVSFRPRSNQSGNTLRSNLRSLYPSLLIIILSLIAFVSGCINISRAITAPLIMSLCLVIYNLVPHLLLFLYWNFGPGSLVSRFCRIGMLLSGAAFVLTIVYMWILYPRDVDYERATDLSLSFLDAQRSGPLPSDWPVQWRSDAGMSDVKFFSFLNGMNSGFEDVKVDLQGGFFNDGEIGPVKVTFNIALTTTMLAWSMLEYPEFWRKDVARQNHAINTVIHGMRYINSAYIITPAKDPLTGKTLSSENDMLVYQVGNIEQQRQEWNRPEDVVGSVPIEAVTGADSPSDLAGQLVAGLVSTALAMREYKVLQTNEAYYIVNKAHRLFRAALFSPGLYTDYLNGTDIGMLSSYPSQSYGDDLFWGATWMFRAANQFGIRTTNLSYYYEAMQITMDIAYADRDIPGLSYDYMNNVAVVHAASQVRDLKFHDAAQSFFWDWLCDSSLVTRTRNGRAFFFDTPLLGASVTVAGLAALYTHTNRDWNLVYENQNMVTSIKCLAVEQGRYILGAQLNGIRGQKPFVVGYDKDTYTRLWHRGSSCPAWPSPCDVSAAYSDEPDVNTLYGALLWNPIFDDAPKDARGRNTTVVSLENNWGMPLLYPGLVTQDFPYARCLQDQGTPMFKRGFCRQKRPLEGRLGPVQAVKDVDIVFRGLWVPTTKGAKFPPPPPPAPRPLVADAF